MAFFTTDVINNENGTSPKLSSSTSSIRIMKHLHDVNLQVSSFTSILLNLMWFFLFQSNGFCNQTCYKTPETSLLSLAVSLRTKNTKRLSDVIWHVHVSSNFNFNYYLNGVDGIIFSKSSVYSIAFIAPKGNSV